MTTRKIRALRSLALAVGLSLSASAGASAAPDPENTLLIDMDDGQIVIEMRPDLAPNHVARIKELTREGFYDGVVFHRVIEGFMAQTGDPTGTGMGGSTYPDLDAEFTQPRLFAARLAWRAPATRTPPTASGSSALTIALS